MRYPKTFDVIVVGGGVGNIDLIYTAGVRAMENFIFNKGVRVPVLKPGLGDSADDILAMSQRFPDAVDHATGIFSRRQVRLQETMVQSKKIIHVPRIEVVPVRKP